MQCCMRLATPVPTPATVCYHATPGAMHSGRAANSSKDASCQAMQSRCLLRRCQLQAVVSRAAVWRQPQAARDSSTITSYGHDSFHVPATGQVIGPSAEQCTVTTPRLLTARLSSAADVSTVLQLLKCNTQLLNAIHVSAALVRAVKLQGLQAGKVLRRQQYKSSPIKVLEQNQELDALIALCEATLLCTTDTAGTLAAPSAGPQGLLAACGVRELANICWALAKLGKGQAFAPHAIQAVLNLSHQGTTKAGVQHSTQHAALQGQVEAAGTGTVWRHGSASSGGGHAASHTSYAAPQTTTASTGWLVTSNGKQTEAVQEVSNSVPHLTPRRARARRGALYDATPQALTNLLWAFAHWFASCGADDANDMGSTSTSSIDALIQDSGGSVAAPSTGWTTNLSPHANTTTAQAASVQGQHSSSSIQGAPAAAWLWYHDSSLAAVHAALEVLSAAMLYNLHRASPQDLALTVWSLATLKFTPSKCALMPALTGAITSSLTEQTPQGVASILWGLAKLQDTHNRNSREGTRESWTLPDSAASALVDHALELLPTLASQPPEAAMLMQGLAALGSRRQAVWRGMQEQAAQGGVQYWPPGCISNFLAAYATAKRPCGHVVAALYQSIQANATAQCSDGTLVATSAGAPSLVNKTSIPAGSTHMASHSTGVQLQQQPSLQFLSSWQDQELLTTAWALATLYKATSKAIQLPKGPVQDTAQHHIGQSQGATAWMTDRTSGGVSSQMAMMRDIVQHLLQEATVRLRQDRLPPASVSMAFWVAFTCNVQDRQLLTACLSHAAAYLDQYPASYIAAMLQVPPAQHSQGRGTAQENGASGFYQQVADMQDAQARLWTAFMDVAPAWLPNMMHTQLAAVCEAAVHRWGKAPRRLVNKTLQLVLGAVVLRARRLRQQRLEQTDGAVLFTQPLQQQQQQHLGKQSKQLSNCKDDGWVAVTKDQRAMDTAQQWHASESRHMPTPATIATLMWVLTRSGYSSTQLFQLAVVVMGDADGTSRLSPQQACRMLWACAHANLYSGPLYAQLCGHLGVHLGSLSPDALCEVLGLVAGSRHYEPLLVRAACMQLQRHELEIGPQRAAGLMWSIAYMSAGTLLEWRPPLALLARLAPNMCMEAQVLTLWAIAVQQHVLLGSARRPARSTHTPHTVPVSASTSTATTTGSAKQALEADRTVSAGGTGQAPALDATGIAADTQGFGVDAASEVSQAASAVTSAGRHVSIHHQAMQRHGSDAVKLLCTLLQQLSTVDEQAVSQHPYAGTLLGQAMSWLLASSRQEVRAAAAECVLAWPISLRADVQMCLLASQCSDTMLSTLPVKGDAMGEGQQGVRETRQQLGRKPAKGAVEQLDSAPQQDNGSDDHKGHDAAGAATTPAGGAGARGPSGGLSQHTLPSDLSWYMQAAVYGRQHTSTAIRTRQRLHKQLVQALQELGMNCASSSQLEVAPGRTTSAMRAGMQQGKDGVDSDDGTAAACALLPVSFPGWPIFLPAALPGSLAIILAPANAFARNSASEPLGPLFMTLTLLGDYGWRPAVLDERAWGALVGRAEQQRFLHALLQSWGVQIPADIQHGNDPISQDAS